jgi:hypothetical protein
LSSYYAVPRSRPGWQTHLVFRTKTHNFYERFMVTPLATVKLCGRELAEIDAVYGFDVFSFGAHLLAAP